MLAKKECRLLCRLLVGCCVAKVPVENPGRQVADNPHGTFCSSVDEGTGRKRPSKTSFTQHHLPANPSIARTSCKPRTCHRRVDVQLEMAYHFRVDPVKDIPSRRAIRGFGDIRSVLVDGLGIGHAFSDSLSHNTS